MAGEVIRMGALERSFRHDVGVRDREEWVLEQCRIADRTLTAATTNDGSAHLLLAHARGVMSSVCKYLSCTRSWATASDFENKVLAALSRHDQRMEA